MKTTRTIPVIDDGNVAPIGMYAKFCDFLLYLCLLLTPFSHVFFDRDAGTGTFLKYFYFLFFLASLPCWKRYYRHWNIAIVAYLLMLVIGVFSDLHYWGGGTVLSLVHLIRQKMTGIIFALVLYNLVYNDPRKIRLLCGIIVFLSVFTAIGMVLGIGVREGIEKGTDGIRYSTMGQNSNGTGFSMVLFLEFLIMVLLSIIPVKLRTRVALLIFTPAVLFCFIKVSSRGALLTFMISMPLWLALIKSFSKKIMVTVFMAIAAIGMVFFVLHSDMLRDRIEKTIYERDTGGREAIWHVALDVWRENPIFGAGLIRHPFIISEKVGHLYSLNMPARATHNTYLRALTSSGIVGFLLFIYSFLFTLFVSFRNRNIPYGNYFFICFVCTMVMGMTGNIENSLTTFLFMGLILGYDRLIKDRFKYFGNTRSSL